MSLARCTHCGGSVVPWEEWHGPELRCLACGRPPGPAPTVANPLGANPTAAAALEDAWERLRRQYAEERA